jgi:cephalosporin-C deacetylase-like acetyl esterase
MTDAREEHPRSGPNRRQFITQAAVLALGNFFVPLKGAFANQPSYQDELPDMLLSFLVRKLNALSASWDQERAKVRTPEDIEARNRFVRAKFLEMLGGLPERNPLNPVRVAAHEREGYRVENVMFESHSDFWVTGNLYIPTTGSAPFPGIISPCGHYALARMAPQFQVAYLSLVKSGFVVLAYDPIGQGERRQFWNPQTNRNEIGGPVTWEHTLPGQLLLLIGENLTQYRVWDGMRAIDYLLTRPEVDQERIGCAGQSGGGTFTLFISALDERVKCAVVVEGGTAADWPIVLRPETRIEIGDTEQELFPSAVYGVDRPDMHVAIAPRPLLVLIEKYDPDFNRAADQIRSRYQQLGVLEKFTAGEADDPHAWTLKLRQATTDWFCRWFYNRPGPAREPDFVVEPAENLYCTANGSIRYSHQGDTIFSLILKKQAQLPPARSVPTSHAEFETFRAELQEEIRKLLRYRKANQPLAVRQLTTTPRKGCRIEKLEFLSEPGIYIPTWVFIPEKKNHAWPVLLYVNEAGKQADGMEFSGEEGEGTKPGLLETFARQGNLVVAVDVRGIGETTPDHLGEVHAGKFPQLDDIETVMTYWTWEMNESLFGMRVLDVIRSVDYALTRADADHDGVRLIGKGMGALWSLYAAALDERIASVVCEGGLLSYHSLTEVDRYSHGADIFIPGVLNHFDLPQVAAAIAGRRLAVLHPVDAMKAVVEESRGRAAYRWTQEAYSNLGSRDRFQILGGTPEEYQAGQYLELLAT